MTANAARFKVIRSWIQRVGFGLILGAMFHGTAWGADSRDLWAARDKTRKKVPKNEDSEDAAQEKSSVNWFPDWPVASFDWGIDPVIGARYSSYSKEDVRIETNTVEIGVGASLRNIPVVPGNPGYGTGFHGGLALGQVREKSTVAGTQDTRNYTYQREWAGWENTFYAGHYRHELNLGIGKKIIKTDPRETIQSLRISNDFGFLLLSWWSAHLTWDYIKGFGEKPNKPFLTEHDLWLHTRIFTSFLDMFLDTGPGTTLVDEFSKDSDQYEKLGDGRTDYFKLLMGMRIVWKIGFFGHFKYVFSSSEEALGTYARTGLPEEGVYDSPRLAMPEDSLYSMLFFGIRDLVGGLGVGWYQNTEIYHLSNKDLKETDRSQGFGVMYEASF